jgi:hypothetical protein
MADRGEDVRILHHLEGGRPLARHLLHLLAAFAFRAPVGDGGDEHARIRRQLGLDGRQHLPSGLDAGHCTPAGSAMRDRAGDQSDVGAQTGKGGGDGVALLARRAVGDVAHRVDRLMGGAGGDRRSFLPASGLGTPSSSASMAATISSGSAMRPFARLPALGHLAPFGPTKAMPSRRAPSRFRRVAGCSHIFGFIAGATSTGLSVASSTVEARSLASPAAILAIKSAVAGATTTRSASRDSRIWPTSCSSSRSKRSVKTWSAVSAPTASGVTNSRRRGHHAAHRAPRSRSRRTGRGTCRRRCRRR